MLGGSRYTVLTRGYFILLDFLPDLPCPILFFASAVIETIQNASSGARYVRLICRQPNLHFLQL